MTGLATALAIVVGVSCAVWIGLRLVTAPFAKPPVVPDPVVMR